MENGTFSYQIVNNYRILNHNLMQATTKLALHDSVQVTRWSVITTDRILYSYQHYWCLDDRI